MAFSEVELYTQGLRARLVLGPPPRSRKGKPDFHVDSREEYLEWKNEPLDRLNRDFDIVVNVRPSHEKFNVSWYVDVIQELFDLDDALVKKRYWSVHKETRKARTCFSLCHRIAQSVADGLAVYVHGASLEDVSGAVALGALYLLTAQKDFDPVADMRSRQHFQVVEEKDLRTLIDDMKPFMTKSMFWFEQQKKNKSAL